MADQSSVKLSPEAAAIYERVAAVLMEMGNAHPDGLGAEDTLYALGAVIGRALSNAPDEETKITLITRVFELVGICAGFDGRVMVGTMPKPKMDS